MLGLHRDERTSNFLQECSRVAKETQGKHVLFVRKNKNAVDQELFGGIVPLKNATPKFMKCSIHKAASFCRAHFWKNDKTQNLKVCKLVSAHTFCSAVELDTKQKDELLRKGQLETLSYKYFVVQSLDFTNLFQSVKDKNKIREIRGVVNTALDTSPEFYKQLKQFRNNYRQNQHNILYIDNILHKSLVLPQHHLLLTQTTHYDPKLKKWEHDAKQDAWWFSKFVWKQSPQGRVTFTREKRMLRFVSVPSFTRNPKLCLENMALGIPLDPADLSSLLEYGVVEQTECKPNSKVIQRKEIVTLIPLQLLFECLDTRAKETGKVWGLGIFVMCLTCLVYLINS